MTFLEIACFTKESAILADSLGADRIELCDGFNVGGTTPSLALLQELKPRTRIPVFVMIRPRGGNFCYSPEEYSQMEREMMSFKHSADGFVFGILDGRDQVDVQKCSKLVDLARPLPCTFHRAFDETTDMMQALRDVAECGFVSILTSGGAADAASGAGRLRSLVDAASELGVKIMPGGGVRSSNLAQLERVTGADFYHSSAITNESPVADADEIRALKAICNDRAKCRCISL